MSKLSRDDILKLARLSRLRLSDEEIERFGPELSRILDFVEELNQVDTAGLEPTYQVTGLKNVMRTDEERDYGYTSEDLLKNAPAVENKQFRVKRVL
jgi:aspartyl-tRNA(Asn)/glutamyl-tRNA(Gln) amidotransferase subunit C